MALFRDALETQLASRGLGLGDPAEDPRVIAREPTTDPLVVLGDDVVVVHEEYGQIVGIEIDDLDNRPAPEVELLRKVAAARLCECALCASLRATP